MFNTIDMETWNRRNIFRALTTHEPIYVNLTHNLDITSFISNVKRKKQKFFPCILYGISRLINSRHEFRMDTNENNEIGYYDTLHPCHTLFHPKEEIFTLIYTEFSHDFEKFMMNYEKDIQEYADKPFDPKPLDAKNIFHISNSPWVNFSSVTLSKKSKYEYFIPLFTVSKYFTNGNNILLPVSVHANHAVLDGFHISRFYLELQDWLNSYVVDAEKPFNYQLK